jgi:hypothetical protein
MNNTSKSGVKHTKKDPNSNSERMVADFGNRRVSQQNFSKIVALPKIALDNCGITSHVNVKLVQSKDEKFIKLTPIIQKEGEKS